MRSSTFGIALCLASASIIATSIRPKSVESGAVIGLPTSSTEILREVSQVSTDYAGKQLLTMAWISGIIMLSLAALILYWSKGWLVLLRIQLYLFALSTITITVKSLYVHHDFTYPKVLSGMHLICAFFVTWAMLLVQRCASGKRLLCPTRRQFTSLILPVSFFFALNIGCNNMALALSTASTVEMISATTPLFVAIISVCVGRKLHMDLYIPLAVVCGGIMLCVSQDLSFSLRGTALAFGAAFLRACKSIMQFELMAPKENAQADEDPILDPILVLAWTSLPSACFMLAWSSVTEGTAPLKHLINEFNWPLAFAMGLSCSNACVLNLASLFVIKDLGTVAAQIASQLKTMLVVLGSVAVLGEHVHYLQLVGLFISISGISWYNKREQGSKALLHSSATGMPKLAPDSHR